MLGDAGEYEPLSRPTRRVHPSKISDWTDVGLDTPFHRRAMSDQLSTSVVANCYFEDGGSPTRVIAKELSKPEHSLKYQISRALGLRSAEKLVLIT